MLDIARKNHTKATLTIHIFIYNVLRVLNDNKARVLTEIKKNVKIPEAFGVKGSTDTKKIPEGIKKKDKPEISRKW